MNFNQFLNESSGKPMGLSVDKTKKVAELYAKAISKADGTKCTVNARTLEKDSFDLDCGGEEFAGGSYTIHSNGEVVNNAMPGSPVYGKWNDSVDTIVNNIKKLDESRVNKNESKIEFKVGDIVSRKFVGEDPSQTFKIISISSGKAKLKDTKTGKETGIYLNDLVKESLVNEEYDVSGLSRSELKDAIDYLKAHDISHDYDGREDILYFDMTELDKKGQEQMKKLGLSESLVNERNITIKRQYTDKNPAVTVGKSAKVRNRMLEAIKDGKISQEEFNTILKEMTTDSKRWLRRNAQCFNVSEDGISLSRTGSRILKNLMISEAKNETGLMVIGKTQSDNNKIGKIADDLGFHAEWNAREGYWLFPEDEDNYDELEIELDKAFGKKGVNARFEGIFEATTKAPKIWVPGGFDKEISKYPNSKITRKIVLDAALKWDVAPEDAIKYVEYAWMVDLDENKNNNDMKTKFIYESFQEFVLNKLNESKEAEEASNILDDLLDERGGDMEELHGMSIEDAMDTVKTYGHKGAKAKKIAEELWGMCNENKFYESKLKESAKTITDYVKKVEAKNYAW
jgi:hypothetical protein